MVAHAKPPHSTGLSTPGMALLAFLRLNPTVAATYGITTCSLGCTGCKGLQHCAGVNGKTSIGWMLMQTLAAQGMDVKWYDQLPNGASSEKPKTNQDAVMWIKSVSRRPGARMKQLSERPKVAPPDHSAVQRHHGHLPKVSFPMLVKLAKSKRRHCWTGCGNKVTPATAVALVERQRLVRWVEGSCACRYCGKGLRFSKMTSHQVAACARWDFVCEKGCARRKPLETRGPMHGDDYELNSKFNYGIQTCALPFSRSAQLMPLLGMNALAPKDHYAFKVAPFTPAHPPPILKTGILYTLVPTVWQAELEPIFADKAERSMAEKHEEHCKRGETEYFTLDGGYTAPRNAHGCTMAAHAKSGAIVDVVHRRLTDEGAKSSKGLEVLCYRALLTKPRVAIYETAAMDGCRELIEPTHAAGKRAQGELWHVGKNWSGRSWRSRRTASALQSPSWTRQTTQWCQLSRFRQLGSSSSVSAPAM